MKHIVPLCLALSLAFSTRAFAHDHAGYSHDSNTGVTITDWMALVADDTFVDRISLPGTHDSMSLYGGDAVATQTMSLEAQLDAGIRVLDIRARLIDNGLAIHHGMVYQHANMDDVFKTVTRWLSRHPAETVLMKVKDEYTASNSTKPWAQVFSEIITPYSAFIYTGNGINVPLRELRGKIAVIHYFPENGSGRNYGDVNPYYFNTQDEYTLSTNWDLYWKWEEVKSQLKTTDELKKRNEGTVFMNHLSAAVGSFPYFVASGHSSPGTAAPRLATGLTTPGMSGSYPDFPRVDCAGALCTIAFEGTNVLITNYLNATQPPIEFTGIIMADFPGSGLIRAIVERNLGKAIQVFEHVEYQGASQFFTPGRYDYLAGGNGKIGNDMISSVRVPAGMKVTLYEGTGFSGRSKVLGSEQTSLPDFNDITSSMVVEEDNQVEVFDNFDYSGPSVKIRSGFSYYANSLHNDKISSVRIPPGLSITLYENDGFKGRSKTLTASTPVLSDFNDVTSSLKAVEVAPVSPYSYGYRTQ